MWFPVTCAACGREGRSPCPACARRLRPAPELAPPPGLDGFGALVRYDGTARVLIAAVKYRHARASAETLAVAAADLVDPAAVASGAVVTWAPTSASRRRERGYDQAEVVARVVARCLGLAARPLLRRQPGPPQTGRTRAERLHGPRFTPVAAAPPAVVVVDDVCTTGATLVAAAEALRGAGARWVHGLALARTPDSPVPTVSGPRPR